MIGRQSSTNAVVKRPEQIWSSEGQIVTVVADSAEVTTSLGSDCWVWEELDAGESFAMQILQMHFQSTAVGKHLKHNIGAVGPSMTDPSVSNI